MKCTQSIFKSSNGVSNVSYYIYLPNTETYRGIIQISHGMCEYMARYTQFCNYLCSFGYVVCGNDHIGHGASVSNNEKLGFFAQKDGWQCLIDDVKKLTDIVKKRFPDLPYFLLGHSMGSLITRLYIAEYGDTLDGAILCGTIGPNPIVRTGITIADSLAHSKGITYRSAKLHQLAFYAYNSRFRSAKSMYAWLTRDEGAVEIYENDEKCNFLFTTSGFRDLFTLVQRANSNRCYRATPRELPLLIIAGDNDPAGSYGQGVRHVANSYRVVGVRDLDVIFYKDARHEVLNEINRLEVFGDISRWVEEHLPPPPRPEVPDGSMPI